MAEENKNRTALITGIILAVIFVAVVIWAIMASDEEEILPQEEEIEVNNRTEEGDENGNEIDFELPETNDEENDAI